MRAHQTTPATPRALEDAALDGVTGGGASANENAGSAGGLGVGGVVPDFFAYEPGFRGGVAVVADTEEDGTAGG